MKRSEINAALRELETMCVKEHCYLPPFCSFTPEQWETMRSGGSKQMEFADLEEELDIVDEPDEI